VGRGKLWWCEGVWCGGTWWCPSVQRWRIQWGLSICLHQARFILDDTQFVPFSVVFINTGSIHWKVDAPAAARGQGLMGAVAPKAGPFVGKRMGIATPGGRARHARVNRGGSA
jgi:hypothetical protein